MGQGAPRTTITERNLAQMIPNFRGIAGGIVIDSERGDVENFTTVTTPEQLLERYGNPNPFKYGISLYSALNFLLKSNNLKVRRVNRGQTYPSMLVRSKVKAMVERDQFGYFLEAPVIDPIVKPNGALTRGDIDSFQFPTYARNREVASFNPPLALTDVPENGDTVLYVNNLAPIEVGQEITFKDTTGLAQADAQVFDTYLVTAKEKVQITQEFIELDNDISTVNYGTPVYAVDFVPTMFRNTTQLLEAGYQGDRQGYVNAVSEIMPGDTFKFDGNATEFLCQQVQDSQVYTDVPFLFADGVQGNTNVLFSKVDPLIVPGVKVAIKGDSYTILTVDGLTAELSSPLQQSFQDEQVQIGTNCKQITFDPALPVGVPINQNLLKIVSNLTAYSSNVFAKELVAGTTRQIRVNNNDAPAEGDTVQIDGQRFKIARKFSLDNYVNKVTIATEYYDQVCAVIGSEMFDVVHGDFEQRDAFLIYAASPGEWGNNLAVGIRPHRTYEDSFYLDVYESGKQVETFEVSRNRRLNGFGRQMYIEDVINGQSRFIRVKDNPSMVDEADAPTLPLSTTWYVRQPAPVSVFTQVATTDESLRDGDNLIRISYEEIMEINLNEKLKVGNYEYVIASLQASVVGGPLDTVVLESGLKLDMDALPKASRFLPIGTKIYQQVSWQKTYAVEFNGGITAGQIYSLGVNSKTFSHTVAAGQTMAQVYESLATKINADSTNLVYAQVRTVLSHTWLEVKAQVAGTPYTLSGSSNLSVVETRPNVRQWDFQGPEIITGSIVPNLVLNKAVTMAEGTYLIRDAGANRCSGGWDGNYPTTGQFILALEDSFANKDKVDVLVFMDGGINNFAYQKAIESVVSRRRDCVWFGSVSYEAQANPDIDQGVVKYRRDLAVDSSYGALFAPWIEVYDPYMDAPIWVPIESDAAGNLSYLFEYEEGWHSIAGWTNGKLNRALKVGREYTEGERGVLYDNQINPVKVDPRGRRAIFGQKTLQIEDSPTSRINVRIALLVCGRGLASYLEEQTFTVNDENQRRRHTLNAESYMDGLKTRGAFYDYYVVCNESNNGDEVIDNAEMYLDVYVKPTRLSEYMNGRITIARTGAKFELLLAA